MLGGVEFNLLHHVDVVAKRVRAAAAAAETAVAAHEGDDNTPSGPTGREVKTTTVVLSGLKVNKLQYYYMLYHDEDESMAHPTNTKLYWQNVVPPSATSA